MRELDQFLLNEITTLEPIAKEAFDSLVNKSGPAGTNLHITMNRLKNMRERIQSEPQLSTGGIEFLLWLKLIGRTRVTGVKWEKAGMVTTMNIEGKKFISALEEKRFWDRAAAGEFKKEPQGVCGKEQV